MYREPNNPISLGYQVNIIDSFEIKFSLVGILFLAILRVAAMGGLTSVNMAMVAVNGLTLMGILHYGRNLTKASICFLAASFCSIEPSGGFSNASLNIMLSMIMLMVSVCRLYSDKAEGKFKLKSESTTIEKLENLIEYPIKPIKIDIFYILILLSLIACAIFNIAEPGNPELSLLNVTLIILPEASLLLSAMHTELAQYFRYIVYALLIIFNLQAFMYSDNIMLLNGAVEYTVLLVTVSASINLFNIEENWYDRY